MSNYDTERVSEIAGFYILIGLLISLFLVAMPSEVSSQVINPPSFLLTSGSAFNTQTDAGLISYSKTLFYVFVSMLFMSFEFLPNATGEYVIINSFLNILFFGGLSFTLGWVLINRVADIIGDWIPF